METQTNTTAGFKNNTFVIVTVCIIILLVGVSAFAVYSFFNSPQKILLRAFKNLEKAK